MKKKYLLLLGFLFFKSALPQIIYFSDVAQSMGINFPLQNYHGSVSFLDFDDDGFDDLSFSSRINYPLFIFKNEISTFTDIAGTLELGDDDWSMQVLWCDYDNDGDKDLFIGFDSETTYDRLFKNNGNGSFTDVTIEAGLGTQLSTTHVAAFGDFNNDGWLDLYVTHYSEYTRNYLFKSNGDGTFTDVTFEAGVAGEAADSGFYKLPLAVAFLDFDNDGWADIYVANDHHTGNFLFKNNADGTFTDISESSGTNAEGFMMGIAIGDYNSDGWLDIYTTNDPWGNFLYKNNGDGTFTDVAEDLGLTVNKSCWGTNFADFDNDGYLDLFVCVETGIPSNVNYFFRNNGDETFTRLEDRGLDHTNISFGTAVGDYDNNGYYDIVVNNANASPNLYKNNGGSNNWVKLKLTGIQSNRDAIGTRIEAYFDNKKIIREQTCGISYSSQNSNYTIIGVGSASIIDSIKIFWPASGITDILKDVNVNTLITLSEGETVTGVEENINTLNNFFLYNNYPNPFNSSTTISFQIPEKTFIRISVLNSLGQEIRSISSREFPPGKHILNWDGKNFKGEIISSGIYFINFSAGEINKTLKAICLK